MHVQTLNGVLRPPSLKFDPRGIIFFIVLPLALAAMTVTTTGYSDRLGYAGAFLFVGLLSVIPWWIGEGSTRATWFALRRYRPPLWLLCTLGILLSCVFVGPYVSFITAMFPDPASGAAPAQGQTTSGQSVLVESLIQIARAMFFWIGANYLFDRFLNYPRFRYAEEKSAATSIGTRSSPNDPANALLLKLTKFNDLTSVLIVKAEEHYVRVFGEDDEEMISHRFGAALKDLETEDGFQVHRSYWVRREAVRRWVEDGSKLSLEMSNRVLVPVSGPYQAVVRQLFKGSV